MTMLIEPSAAPAPARSHFHLLSFLLALMNGLGLLMTLLGILIVVVFANLDGSGDSGQYMFMALGWSSAAMMLLLLPGLVYAVRRLAGRDSPAFSVPGPRRMARIGVFLWPLLLLGAYFASQNDRLAGIILPPLQILVIGIPIWFFVELSRSGLPGRKAHQAWGVFSTGMVVVMPVVFVLEILLVGGVVILAASAIMGQNNLAEELNRLAMRLNSGNLDPEIISRALLPILRRPAVLVTIILTASGLVPLVEELFKPLGMWALSRKRLTPAQGFNLGMVSGAAFALIESLGFLAGVSGPDWVWTVIGRVGSGLLHITASGLVGWGLAEAWTNKRYGRLALSYLAAVGLHGLWNLFGLMVGLVPFIDVTAGLVGFLRGLGVIAPYALVVIGGGMLTILLLMNRHLRRQAAQAALTAGPDPQPQPPVAVLADIPASADPDPLENEADVDGIH